MKQSKKYYAKSMYLTVAVYVAIIFILFVSIRSARLLVPGSNPNAKIVQAVTVNQNQVNAEIQRIKSQEASKKAAELEKQKQLAKQVKEAKSQREQEEKRVAALKVQQQQLEVSRKATEEKAKIALAEMQKKHELMKKQLADLQKQRAATPVKTPVLKLAPTQQPVVGEKKTIATQNGTSEQEKTLQSQIEAEEQQMSAAQNAAWLSEVDKYKALILNAIGQQWIVPSKLNKDLSMRLLIHLAPGGTVLDVTVQKSSGDAALDRSVLTALWKASPLPVPADLQLFDQFRELNLTVRPEGLLND